jgi:hypothetical protein
MADRQLADRDLADRIRPATEQNGSKAPNIFRFLITTLQPP